MKNLVSKPGFKCYLYRYIQETQPDAKEERVMLLEAWRAFEESVGSEADVIGKVEKKMPRRVKRKRPIYTEDGTPAVGGLCAASNDAHWSALYREPMTRDFVSSSSNRCCRLWCRPSPTGQEEYYDYIFPEEQGAVPNLKILEAAYKWKRQKTGDE